MIRNTFQHIPGFGRLKEESLWESGVKNWDDFVIQFERQQHLFDEDSPHGLLADSISALSEGDADFFAQRLPSNEYYRIALTFPKDVMFLDIETTGLSRYYDQITLIGWSFLNEFDVYYQGRKTEIFHEALARAKAVVTFNGSLFDLPFLKKTFPDIRMPLCHIDLRFFSRRFGFRGGQKNIEKEIGFHRNKSASSVTGEFAPVLWHRYKEGSLSSLRQLIEYNRHDIEGMKAILDLCIERKIGMLGSASFPRPIRFAEFKSRKRSPKVQVDRYTGKAGPRINLADLPQYPELNIVGIDLTGSEVRPSGWCHMHNGHVDTARIASDADLISRTLASGAEIVSIDSPLSLPLGRLSVFDDDPGRDEFGIMRICERILKSRGVNVYPSLIQSMQKLTLRGIGIADELRKMGIPVIECYPGAAQDILGIPRKGSSLEYLTRGLAAFGVGGSFLEDPVSHDELDAITAAVLGYFFWCGKFEALGNEHEDYLIIPDIFKTFPGWTDKHVIGLSGPLASGKTTAGEFFEDNGYAYGRFSMIIARLVEDDGLVPNRRNLQEKGHFVNEKKGQRWLCQRLVDTLFADEKRIVIDGLRFAEDFAFLRERFGPHFTHIHIQANDQLRRKRYNASRRNDVRFSVASDHPVERSVTKLQALADMVISNDSEREVFYEKLFTQVRQ